MLSVLHAVRGPVNALQAHLEEVDQNLKKVPSNVVADCVSTVIAKREQSSLTRTPTYPLSMTPCKAAARTPHVVKSSDDASPDCENCVCHDKLNAAGYPADYATWTGEDQWYGSIIVGFSTKGQDLSDVDDQGLHSDILARLPERLKRVTRHIETGHTSIKMFSSMSLDVDLLLWYEKSRRRINAILVKKGNVQFWDDEAPVPISSFKRTGRTFTDVEDVVDAVDPLREAFLNYAPSAKYV